MVALTAPSGGGGVVNDWVGEVLASLTPAGWAEVRWDILGYIRIY